MTDLLAARTQMALSLGFHIIFAEIGIALPVMMVAAEVMWRRTGDSVYLDLAKRWAKGTAILFAVGAVSGTVLSFELGLLWPGFMRMAGPLIGIPFSLEGFAFFLEAIFLGVYLYGWNRVGPWAHIAAGVLVAGSGAASAVFVVMVNAWMNTPVGFTLASGGQLLAIDPIVGMRSPAAFQQALHMVLAAYAATGFAVAGVHAWVIVRGRPSAFHRRAIAIALAVGAPAALLQPVSGDISARVVAATQPVKLAALEGQWETRRRAPLRIGGWPDASREETRFAIEVPGGLSFLAFHDVDAEVKGLMSVARSERPPVAVVHLAFQAMVGLGSLLAAIALFALVTVVRKRELGSERWLLIALCVATPAGYLATEAGWIVTEVGRQPWVVQGVMRTADAVTPMPGLVVPLGFFTTLYLGLAVVVMSLIASLVKETADMETADGVVSGA